MTDLGPNAHLIGVQGSRGALDTPALVLDLDIMERNIASMAAHARSVGVKLRPHAKTHKSVKIAERQVRAGALGICCATLGEAEVMVRAGIPGVHITSPQVTLSKIERLFALNAHDHQGLSVVVDNPTNLTALAAAAQADGKPLDVLVDFYAGHGRTGAVSEEAVLELAWGIGASRVLRFRGLQAYAGNLQHLAVREERRAKTLEMLKRLAAIVERLKKESIPVPIVTGAGTGTFDLDPEAHVFTELQVGSYIFATDGPKPEIARGAPEGATYAFFGDEHGKLILPEGVAKPEIGHRLECVTPHDDPTVNLYDVYHVVRGDTLIDIWPVDARGKR
jgi:D-serine deaminase-like pyridoxal phosphate-dependent protein